MPKSNQELLAILNDPDIPAVTNGRTVVRNLIGDAHTSVGWYEINKALRVLLSKTSSLCEDD